MEYEDRYRQARGQKYDCLLFDLDDTLNPRSSGLAAVCTNNIRGIDKNTITHLSNLLYNNYGTTMAGLRAIGYDFDYDEYHRCPKIPLCNVPRFDNIEGFREMNSFLYPGCGIGSKVVSVGLEEVN